jgi:23S rRNA (uracil1939-C5)-methyltransferase
VTGTAAGGQEDLYIETLGRHGDGVARGAEGPVYVAGALPGEQVRISREGTFGHIERILTPSADRRAAPCRHYRSCGGCTLQHMRETACLDWKQQILRETLARHDLDPAIAPILKTGHRARRRAVLRARRTRKDVVLGFHGRRSDQITQIDDCLLLTPALGAVLEPLRQILRPVLTRRGEAGIHLLETVTGVDVMIEGGRPASLGMLDRMARAAASMDLARLSWNGEVIAERRRPELVFGEARVTPPPGAFVQAVGEAETYLVSAAMEWLAGAHGIADLFCGCGTFSLPLARRATVHSVDAQAGALEALKQSAARTTGLKPVTVEKRDLFKEPLPEAQLRGHDAVLFDPPRAGAAAQCAELAKADARTIVAISCNPVSFARDARVLVDGGYELVEVRPVDQFPYSPHVELAACFRRS